MQEAQPQARAERARKGPEVERAVRRVGGDSPERRPFVAELAVGIVLEHIASASPRPRRDGVAPLGRENVSGRELMGWRDIEERRRALRQIVGHEPLFVHRDPDDLRSGGGEGERRRACAGILDRRRRAAMKEEARRERDPFLNAPGDDDAARIGDNAARRREMGGDGRSERRQPGGIALLGQAGGAAVRKLRQQESSPQLERKERRVGAAGSKIISEPGPPGGPSRRRAGECRRRRHRPERRADRRARRGRGLRRVADVAGHEHARRWLRLGQSLDRQGLVGADHGVASDFQLLGETPARRQPGAARQAPLADRLAQLIDDLVRQAVAAGTIQEERQLHVGTEAWKALQCKPDGRAARNSGTTLAP